MLKWDHLSEEFALITGKLNREISLYMLDGKKTEKAATFLMEIAPTFLSCSIVGKGITIAAVTGAALSVAVVHLFIVENIR